MDNNQQINKDILEQRLTKIAHVMDNATDYLKYLDFAIPQEGMDILENMLGSKELNAIVNGIRNKRAPRILIMGRSGVGKSSLINAMFGTYLAETSPVNVGTKEYEIFSYKRQGKVLFEIMDTRGIKENIQEMESTAEEDLKNAIKKFVPDAFLFLTNAADRSTLEDDTKSVKEFRKLLFNNTPLITVITRVDQLPPPYLVLSKDFNEEKLENIRVKEIEVKNVLENAGINDSKIVPVSAYIEWEESNPESLKDEEKDKVKIKFDGRYNIDKLIETIEDNIEIEAAVAMMVEVDSSKALEKIANRFNQLFSGTAGTIGASPIPFADMFILFPIQIMLVLLIAYLGGHEPTVKSVREFIVSLGTVGIFGFGLRFVAQAGSKLLNLVVPAAGSAVSASIAYSGTFLIGKAATAYYVNNMSIEDVREIVKKAENKEKSQETKINEAIEELDEKRAKVENKAKIKQEQDILIDSEEKTISYENDSENSEDKSEETKGFFRFLKKDKETPQENTEEVQEDDEESKGMFKFFKKGKEKVDEIEENQEETSEKVVNEESKFGAIKDKFSGTMGRFKRDKKVDE